MVSSICKYCVIDSASKWLLENAMTRLGSIRSGLRSNLEGSRTLPDLEGKESEAVLIGHADVEDQNIRLPIVPEFQSSRTVAIGFASALSESSSSSTQYSQAAKRRLLE